MRCTPPTVNGNTVASVAKCVSQRCATGPGAPGSASVMTGSYCVLVGRVGPQHREQKCQDAQQDLPKTVAACPMRWFDHGGEHDGYSNPHSRCYQNPHDADRPGASIASDR